VALIRDAFATWSSYANVTFRQTASTAVANIVFSDSYIDGLNSVLGRTSYSYSGQKLNAARVNFDSSEDWHTSGSTVISDSEIKLYTVALHEIGHAIGMDHYNDTPAVMNSYIDRSVTGLTASDIAGIQALYGASAETVRHDFVLHNDSNGIFASGSLTSGSVGYTKVGSFGAEWSFAGAGDFLGDGHTDFLLRSSSGAVSVAEIQNGQTTYTSVGTFSAEWQTFGSGNFDGQGTQDVLLHSRGDGSLVVASVVNGTLSYAKIGGFGSEWATGVQTDSAGNSHNATGLTGDFLGSGHVGVMLHNTQNGAVVVAEDINSAANFTKVGQFGLEWEFFASGDFNANGRSDMVLHSTGSGALVVAEVVNGNLAYTKVGGFGNEWQAVGAGDYLNDGHMGVLLHSSTSGALVVAEIVNAQAAFTQISSVGNEWHILA